MVFVFKGSHYSCSNTHTIANHCRDVVAEMLAALDPVGVRERSRRRLIRRCYRLKVKD